MCLIENNTVTLKWVATHSEATLLFSMGTVTLASLQNCCSVDADTRCERALNTKNVQVNLYTFHTAKCGGQTHDMNCNCLASSNFEIV